ncbi:MAG: HAD-IA family hydrolase [Clostridia bacterium]|nr:HAD-IA family hydrolase [Clostridia bacterium]
MKHFIFDMGGVLVKPIPHELVENEISYVKCDTPEFKKYFWDTFYEFEKGTIDTNRFVEIFKNNFNKKGLTTVEYENNYYEIGKKYGGVFENAYEVLKNLKENGCKVYLLSNLHEVSFKDFSSIFDVSIFDKLFLSYKIGLIKPDNNIYKYVINEINDDPREMCFFDDKIENVEAAISNGMNSFQTTGDILEKNVKKAFEL